MISRIVIAAVAVSLLSAQAHTPTFVQLQPDIFGDGATLVNAFADYNGDGTPDLFVGFNGLPNRLYRNVGGHFTDVAGEVGVADARPTRAAAWGDIDGDGDADLLVGFAPGAASVLKWYRNDGGKFTDVTNASGIARDSGAVRQLSMIDVDGDGDLDVFVGMRDRSNMLLRNTNGRFTDVAANVGLADTRKTVGAVWFDYDHDGDLDLFVANMDGDRNGLFKNNGGLFTDVAEAAGVAWGGRTPNDATNGTVRVCAADVNGDGALDLFAANYGKNGLLLNRGNGTFEDVSMAWGLTADGRHDACAFEDFDNDGRIDVYVNGTVTGGTSYPDYLYRNTGSAFEMVTPVNIAALGADHGVHWVDVDGDGAVDLALTGSAAKGLHGVWRNVMPAAAAARSLHVRVLDAAGHATRPGAEVRVYATGTRRLLGMRLIDTGSGYDAQNDLPVHFGFADQAPVDVEVAFPERGKRTLVVRRAIDVALYKGKALVVRVPSVP